MKKRIFLYLTSFLILSCSSDQERNNQPEEVTNTPTSHFEPEIVVEMELSQNQERAFEALNDIQVQGDHLYSTFSGIHHDCLPADTSFTISQDELLFVLNELLIKYYAFIPAERRESLASKSVLAQEEYLVLECNGNAIELGENTENQLPTSGSWILPEVLDRRDIIIVW